MATKLFRYCLVLVMLLSALGFSASAALADAPTKTTNNVLYTTVVTTDLCAYPITINIKYAYTAIVYYDNSGAVTREFDHVIELDEFVANGKTLTSNEYPYNIQWLLDSGGNLVHEYVSGGPMKVLLPDGSVFSSAGRVDAVAHPGTTFYLPDFGHATNLAGFCAALAP